MSLRTISLVSSPPSSPILDISKTCIACQNGNHGEPDGPVTACSCPCHEDRHVARFMKQRNLKKVENSSTKGIDKVSTGGKVKSDTKQMKEKEAEGQGRVDQTPILPLLNMVMDLTPDFSSGKFQVEKKDGKLMSFMIIGRDTLPVSARGKVGTCSVSVRENGQIGFSNSAGKVFDNFTATVIGWDGTTRTMAFTPVNLDKLPKGVNKEKTFPVGLSEKIGTRYISAASLFKDIRIAYDFKGSGTHSFPADIKDGTLTFVLPVKMEPKPKVERKAKAAASTGNGGSRGEPELQEA